MVNHAIKSRKTEERILVIVEKSTRIALTLVSLPSWRGAEPRRWVRVSARLVEVEEFVPMEDSMGSRESNIGRESGIGDVCEESTAEESAICQVGFPKAPIKLPRSLGVRIKRNDDEETEAPLPSRNEAGVSESVHRANVCNAGFTSESNGGSSL